MVERQRALIADGRLRRRGPRHRHRRQPRRRRSRSSSPPADEERARRRAAETGEDAGGGARRRSATATRATASASTAPLRAADDAVELDTTGPRRRRGRRADRRARPRAGARRERSRPLQVAVVGFPNVGKSTLVNRLAGGREAVTHAEPGVTRDRKELELRVERRRRSTLIDTGGVDLADDDALARAVQAPGARRRSRRPTRSCSSSTRAPGLRPGDAELATTCAAPTRPVLVAANKVDRPGDAHLAAEFHALGLGEPLAGLGRRTASAPATCSTASSSCARRRGRRRRARTATRSAVAIIGRPNVGKSSLVNAFLGAERVIVSERRRHHPRRDRHRARGRRPRRSCSSTPPGCGAAPRSRARSTTTRSCAPSARPSAPTSRSSSATRPRASPPRTCGSRELAMQVGLRHARRAQQVGRRRDRPRRRDARGSSSELRLRPPVITLSALTRPQRRRSCCRRRSSSPTARAERIPTPELNRFVADVVAADAAAGAARQAPAPLLRGPGRRRARRASRSRSTTAR